MTYDAFVQHVNQNGWSAGELRCDVRPSSALLEFIETVGDSYEAFVLRYLQNGAKS